MQAILDMFDERVQEIDLYFEAIKELDRGSIGHATDTHYFNEELYANQISLISFLTPE